MIRSFPSSNHCLFLTPNDFAEIFISRNQRIKKCIRIFLLPFFLESIEKNCCRCLRFWDHLDLLMSHGTYIYILIILFFPISRLYRPTFYYHSKLSITWILKKSLLLIEAKLLGPLVIPRPSFSCSAALEATRCIDDASTLLTPISLSRDFHGPRVSIRVFALRLIYTSIDPPAPSVAASINQPYGLAFI